MTYHIDTEQWARHGTRLACGHLEMRARITVHFAEPDLNPKLLSRTVIGHIVVDHERVTRIFPDSRGHVDIPPIWEVADSRIEGAMVALGKPVNEPR